MSREQNTQKTMIDELTLSGIHTLTIELDMGSYDEDKARQIASEFVDRLDGNHLAVEEEDDDYGEGLDQSGERRRHTRTPSTLSTLAHKILASSPSTEPVKGFVVNMSLTGMALISESEEICKGDVIELEVMDGVIPFSVTALVVKKNPVFGAARPYFSYGLRIMKMNQQARTSIERIISGRAA